MKKLFTSDKFFGIAAILGCIGLIAGGILGFIIYPEYLTLSVQCIVMGLAVYFMASSYRKHSKNVMKGLLGALLMAALLSAIECFGSAASLVDKVCAPIVLVAVLGLFVSHFYINSDHHSKPGMIRLNQVLWLVLAVVWALNVIAWACVSGGALSILMSVVVALGRIFMGASVVCVESRLDAYRIEREANGYKAE